MDATAAGALARLGERIGPGVRDLGFRLHFADGGTAGLDQCRVDAVEEDGAGGLTVGATLGHLAIRWSFAPWSGGYWVELEVQGARALGCFRLDGLMLTYDAGDDLADWLAPTLGLHVEDAGLLRVGDLTERSAVGDLLRGAFPSAKEPGLFVGTRIPQRSRHVYDLRRSATASLRLTCSTRLTDGLAQGVAARSESTWVCATQPLAGSIEAYAAHVPRRADPPHPPVGWSTWDYYYCGVGAEDVFENVAEIERDPVLRRHLTHVQIDMGWEHRFGEWQANHRFPGGMEALATGLRERGFVPGIWTAPVLIDPLSRPGLRDAQLLLKDAHGDPLRHADGYLLDPTHPAGRSLVEEVYTRLYRAGFRYFKVDFVDALVEAPRFHDPTKGPYDVLRDLFALIRSCVGQESRILGCSLPAATGPWVADYGRTGVDIHNQWTHVEWAADFLQLTFWLHHRIWVNDPDYLVVRGGATSREAVTTVLNPTEHQPNPPRWRRGPTFATVEEARAWGSLVALSGGSMFLGDRLAMLNEAGRSLLPPLLQPTGVAARPLDLGDGPRASLWLQELPREWRLGVVNWSGEPTTKRVVFGAYGLPAPSAVTDIWTGSVIPVRDGGCEVPLAARDAAVLVWDRESPG